MVGDHADEVLAEFAGPDAALSQGGDEGCRRHAEGRRVTEDDVGLNGTEVDAKARGCCSLGQKAGMLMVFMQAARHGFQSDNAGGGDNADLAHAAAHKAALAAGLFDEVARTDHEGAHGGAEALGQAELDGIGMAAQFFHVRAQGGGGVEDAGAVHVNRQGILAGHGGDGSQFSCRIACAAGIVVGILDGDEPCPRCVHFGRTDGVFDLQWRQLAMKGRNGPHLSAGIGADAGRLGTEDVGRGIADDFVAASHMDADGHLIAQGAAGHEQARFLARHVGGQFFQGVDRRILPVAVVTDVGMVHGVPHFLGGFGHGIAAQINHNDVIS